MSVGKIVDNVIGQINGMHNAESIKRVLFLRLETELNSGRCDISGYVKPEANEFTDVTPEHPQ